MSRYGKNYNSIVNRLKPKVYPCLINDDDVYRIWEIDNSVTPTLDRTEYQVPIVVCDVICDNGALLP